MFCYPAICRTKTKFQLINIVSLRFQILTAGAPETHKNINQRQAIGGSQIKNIIEELFLSGYEPLLLDKVWLHVTLSGSVIPD